MWFLKGNQDTSRAPNINKQPCSCQTSLRNLLFHLVQRISLHFKSTDLYLFCTTKVFPKFLLPFQSQASFQSEQFGSYNHAARSLSLVACSLTSQRSRMLMQKDPCSSFVYSSGKKTNCGLIYVANAYTDIFRITYTFYCPFSPIPMRFVPCDVCVLAGLPHSTLDLSLFTITKDNNISEKSRVTRKNGLCSEPSAAEK